MLKEFAVGDLLFTPMAIFIVIAFIATFLTHLIIPERLVTEFLFPRAWLNIFLFICYLALFMYYLGA